MRKSIACLLLGAIAVHEWQLAIPAMAAGQIFVSNWSTGTIGEYATSGANVNGSLLTNLGTQGPAGIAIYREELYVANQGKGTIGKYTTSGTTLNASLISNVFRPQGIAVNETNIFITSPDGKISKYTTAGALVSASLVEGFLNGPADIVVSGTNLFVANSYSIGKYTISGDTVNASLIDRLTGVQGLTVWDDKLFVVTEDYNGNGTIGEYTLSGVPINASLITGLRYPGKIAAFGGNLFVPEFLSGKIGEYTTSGVIVNSSLVTGLGQGLTAIATTPEPSTLVLAAFGFIALAWRLRRRRT